MEMEGLCIDIPTEFSVHEILKTSSIAFFFTEKFSIILLPEFWSAIITFIRAFSTIKKQLLSFLVSELLVTCME